MEVKPCHQRVSLIPASVYTIKLYFNFYVKKRDVNSNKFEVVNQEREIQWIGHP